MTIFTVMGKSAAGIALVIEVTAGSATEALLIAARLLSNPTILF